jgi:O-succinylbenzoic acid--CoA ligase
MPEQPDDIAGRWEAGERFFSFNTSGSTGAPKTIQHTRALLEWSALQTGKAIQVRQHDHQLICLPLDKTAGFMQVVRSLVWKIPMTIVAPSADPISGLPAEHPFTVVSLTPMQLSAVMHTDTGRDRLRRFRVILIGGEAVQADLESTCLDAGVDFLHTYGMTETASHIALRRAGTAGFRLLDGVQIQVNEADGHLAIALEDFPEMGWLHTRDLAERLPDGTFRLIGRLDNAINSGGVKIIPEPVESALAESGLLPGRSLALIGMPDAQFGQRCVLAVSGEPSQPDWSALRAVCEKVQRYSTPRAVFFLAEWPVSDNGKLLRREILAILASGMAIESAERS